MLPTPSSFPIPSLENFIEIKTELNNLSKIKANTFVHKNRNGHFIPTGGSKSYIWGSQAIANFIKQHKPEDTAKDIEVLTKRAIKEITEDLSLLQQSKNFAQKKELYGRIVEINNAVKHAKGDQTNGDGMSGIIKTYESYGDAGTRIHTAFVKLQQIAKRAVLQAQTHFNPLDEMKSEKNIRIEDFEMIHVEEKKEEKISSGGVLDETKQFNFEDFILEKDREALKKDIHNAMRKIINFVTEDSAETAQKLRKTLKGVSGRDWMTYAPVKSFTNDLLGLMKNWDDSWSIEETAALLMDISLVTKRVSNESFDNELSAPLWEVRGGFFLNSKNSKWVQDLDGFNLDSKKDLHFGPSLSTGMVLRFLRLVKKTEPREKEAIINGLIQFWKNSNLKRLFRLYHTPAEVWAAYTHDLEKLYAKEMIEKSEGNKK